MPSDQQIEDMHQAQGTSSGRITLLLIAGVPVIVILASSWLWYYVANGELDIVGALGTSNAGALVQPPRQASEYKLALTSGESYASTAPPRWTLVVPLRGSSCDAACESRLYNVRQIHQSLGKELGRVQRFLVTDGSADELLLTASALSDGRPVPTSFSSYLETEQRGMTLWQTPAEAFGSLFAELNEYPESWYLMDPAGWVMMRYDTSISYKDVISDLKFLIKNSNG